jgi:hypothetical protein
MKIRPVGAELLHADRRTDGRTDGRSELTKLIVAFRNFAHAPKSNSDEFTDLKAADYICAGVSGKLCLPKSVVQQ